MKSGHCLDQARAAAQPPRRASAKSQLDLRHQLMLPELNEESWRGGKMGSRSPKLEVGVIFLAAMGFGCEAMAQDLTTATVPFFITLRFGEERIIAQNGALELRARCILGSGISGDSLELVVTSTVDGWLATSAGRSTTTQNLAGSEIVLFTAVGQPDQGRL